MYHLLFYLSLTTLFISLINIWREKRIKKKKEHSLIVRFRKKAHSRSRVLEKFLEKRSNKLLLNPNYDLKISNSDPEEELREKANIHRARLSKHGKSKLNGKLYFQGPKCVIFIINKNGKKKYI